MNEKKLTPDQEAAAMLLAARASNFAINSAITKFTPEQEEKIHAAALQRLLEKTTAAVQSGYPTNEDTK